VRSILRPLAWVNILAAIGFILPVAVWFAVEHSSRGTLALQFPASQSIERNLAEIRSITDIEKLRHRAITIEQTREFDRRIRQVEEQFTKLLGEGLGLFLLFASAVFLVNACLMLWVLRKQQAPH